MSGLMRKGGHLSPRARRVSPGTAREDTKWAWDIHKFVLVRKTGENFGLYIRGGREFGFGIYVSGLDKGGHAEKHGMRVGDRIIRVNDVDFREIDHLRAVAVIQSTSRLIIYVSSHRGHRAAVPVNKRGDEVDRPRTPVRVKQKPKSPQKQKLFLVPEDDGYLGCSIRGGSDYGMEVCISEVDASSPAKRAGLRRGDFIRKVNGMDLKGMTHMQVVSLATAFTELYLDIERKECRKMSLPMAEIFSEETPPSIRKFGGRRYSGPVLSPPSPTENSTNHNFATEILQDEEKISNLMDTNIGDTITVQETEPSKTTKLVSRTIRLNLNVRSKDGKFCDFQESPKSIKRCQQKVDVRSLFRSTLPSPGNSPSVQSRQFPSSMSCTYDGRRSRSRASSTSSINDLQRWTGAKEPSGGYASVMNISATQWSTF